MSVLGLQFGVELSLPGDLTWGLVLVGHLVLLANGFIQRGTSAYALDFSTEESKVTAVEEPSFFVLLGAFGGVCSTRPSLGATLDVLGVAVLGDKGVAPNEMDTLLLQIVIFQQEQVKAMAEVQLFGAVAEPAWLDIAVVVHPSFAHKLVGKIHLFRGRASFPLQTDDRRA